MKRAGREALAALAPLLAQLRGLDGLVEKKPGIFYRRSQPFLHFHEDPAGLFADLKLGGQGNQGFERFPLSDGDEQAALLREVARMLETSSH